MTTHPIDDTDSSETTDRPEEFGLWAVDWVKRNHRRLWKFGLVGGVGVFVNWLFFEIGVAVALGLGPDPAHAIGVILGITFSIFTNFVLNDLWTWGDRSKHGGFRGWLARMGKYYIGASVAGGVQFVTFWPAKAWIWGPLDLHFPGATVLGISIPSGPLAPRLALLTGIALGMAINFLVGHLWAFRDPAEGKGEGGTS